MKRAGATPTHPLLILGLDGGTFSILDALGNKGELPNLTRLAREGLRATLESTQPVATLPAWTSFLTAARPGRHGVTDIFVRRPGTYELEPAGGHLRSMPTFLERLSHAGLRVASLGVPATFPPLRLNGLCVAGFDAPGVHRAERSSVWPDALWPQLERLGGWRYATFNEHGHGPRRLERATRALLSDLDDKERVILSLFEREPWDVFFAHLQASDTAAHHLWHAWDSGSPRHRDELGRDALPSVYRRLDALIGRLLARAPEHTRVLVVSDHGMGGASNVAVHLNRLLAELGLLRFADALGGRRARLARHATRLARGALGSVPPALLSLAVRRLPAAWVRKSLSSLRQSRVAFEDSDAFSHELDYAPSIWLNCEGELPRGRVPARRVHELCDTITRALLALRHPETSELLVSRVIRREESSLAGEHLARVPHLIIEPAWPGGYRTTFLASQGPGPSVRLLDPAELDAPKGAGMAGVHHRNGVFLAAGPGIRAQRLPALGLAEAGAAVYHLLGLEPPNELDAQAPEALRAALATDTVVRVPQTNALPASDSAPPYSAAEQLLITERLRQLGYLE